MAKEILAASARRRNSILRILSTNGSYLCNNASFPPNPPPYSLHELDILIGLAFTAILAQGRHVEKCRSKFEVYLDHRHENENVSDFVVVAVSYLLRKGFAAFKFIGYPYYFDDFIMLYYHILKTTIPIFPTIKHEMQKILNDNFN
jgi:hypothetical protein